MSLQIQPELGRPDKHRADPFLELVDHAMLASRRGSADVLQNQGRLARAGRTGQQGACASKRTAVEQRIEFGKTARHWLPDKGTHMLSRDQSRKHLDPPGADLIIMPALSGRGAAHLRDLNSPARASEIEGPAFQPDNAVA